jgi:thymidine kinase
MNQQKLQQTDRNKHYKLHLLYLMLGECCRRSAERKQRVNKKRKVEFDSAVSSGGQGKYNNC